MVNKIYHGTFGSGQLGTLGLHYHVEIHAPDMIFARLIMNDAFNGKWSGVYEESFKYPEKYNTRKLGRLVFLEADIMDKNKVYFSSHIL